MSKYLRTTSSTSDYSVGYGRPPTKSRFAPGTSGNPHGRPKRKERTQCDASQGDLSMLHKAVLETGSKMVEIKRGTRRVKVSTHEAVLEGIIDAARHGNTRAADMYLKSYQEAEALVQRQRVNTDQGAELSRYIGRLIRGDGEAKRENERLKARIAELESAAATHIVEPKWEEAAKAKIDSLSGNVAPASAQKACEPPAASIPEIVNARPLTQTNAAVFPIASRRRRDPLIASPPLTFGGGFGVSGGRET